MADNSTVQKIESLDKGKIWKPITFNVIYKFPKPSFVDRRISPIKCIIADDSGLVTLLFNSKDEKDYDVFKIKKCYTIMAGGCFCNDVNLTFNHLFIHSKKLELWLSDKAKIVAESEPFFKQQQPEGFHFNFKFINISKLAKGVNVDILARVEWQGPEEDGANGVRQKSILLMDESVGKKQAVRCRLMGDHRKIIRSKGVVIALFNAYVGSEGSDLLIHVNSSSAAFVVSTKDWDWILNEKYGERKTYLLKVGKHKMAVNDAHINENDEENTSVPSDAEPGSILRPEITSPKKAKIEINRKSSSIPMPSSIKTSPKKATNCCNISTLKTLLDGKRRSGMDIEVNGVHLSPDFVIRRYLGCAKCSKSLKVEDGNYVCYGKICCKGSSNKNLRNDPSQRKSYYLLKNLRIKDDNEEFEDNLMAYNDTVQDFLKQDADEFKSDSSVVDKFTLLTKDRLLNVLIKATRKGVGSNLKQRPWDLSVVKLSVPDTENADIQEFHASTSTPIPDITDNIPFSNDEVVLRKLLAQKVPLEVSVRRGDYQLPQNEEDEYTHFKKPQGIALHIYSSKNRKGSDADAKTFEDLFQGLHYDVITAVDVNSNDLVCCIAQCRSMLVKHKFESFVLCISGHGLSNTILLADNALKNIWTDVIYQFDDTNFPEFRGRPKIVLVNACQTFARADHPHVPFVSPSSSPNHPDFLVFVATSPGFEAYRSPDIGTHFIRTLAAVFMRHAHNTEIKKLFNMVAKLLHSPDESANQYPQLPEIREFIFSKYFFFRP